jgi:hypothetical protein
VKAAGQALGSREGRRAQRILGDAARRLGLRSTDLLRAVGTGAGDPEAALAAAPLVVALEKGPSPTTDFYLAPRVPPGALRRGDLRMPPGHGDLPPGSLVVFVRYLSVAGRRAAPRRPATLAGVALLLDDDMDAAVADVEAPPRWRMRVALWHHAPLFRAGTAALDAVWVSTPTLRALHPSAGALAPKMDPVSAEALRANPAPPRPPGLSIVFAGTAVHAPVLDFVAAATAPLLAERPDARLLVCGAAGDGRGAALAGHPQVTFRPQSAWDDYRRFALDNPADVLLAPLAPGPLGVARSETKRLDACRFRAAGIFAAGGRAGRMTEDGVDGLVVGRSPEDWRAALGRLADDAALRARLVETARRRLVGG